jgi:predicted acylesterase/phospholipase RssA
VAVRVTRAGPDAACVKPAPPRDVLVGVALSGGGSRAALFGAGGLEALARLRAPGGGSVLEQVDYLSSVSGGSLAASYYASQKPPRERAVLMPDGALTGDYQAFFDRYKSLLTQDFESALIWRQVLHFRWLNSALAARSLFEILEERLLGSFTFEQLSQRETRGDSPYLIVNTTLYNNGRRLTFTTLPGEAARYDFFEALRASLARQGKPTEIPPALLERWNRLLPVTPSDLHADPCPMKLAAAVAGSASFPPLVGPITPGGGRGSLLAHRGRRALREPGDGVAPLRVPQETTR